MKLRRAYKKNKPRITTEVNVPAYDEKLMRLMLFALNDDSCGTITINEWKRWITRGASMESSRRESGHPKIVIVQDLVYF